MLTTKIKEITKLLPSKSIAITGHRFYKRFSKEQIPELTARTKVKIDQIVEKAFVKKTN